MQAPKVIAETGAKSVAQCVSAERGSLVTMCGVISASGSSVPPLYIFPRVRMKDYFLNSCVPGAVGYAEKSGWMTAAIFIKLLEHIKYHTNCSLINKILLSMDNHETHISLEAVTYARDNGIILLSFPPHCTHKMQPLDRGIYAPFKTKCKISFNDFIASNPGKTITIADVAKLTAEPYLLTFNPKNIVSSFKNTGIYPLNSLVYSDDDFKPTYAMDRPDPSCSLKANSILSEIVLNVQDTAITNTLTNDKENISVNKNQDNNKITNGTESTLSDIDKATKPKINIISQVIIKPSDIKPFPKAGPRQGNRKPREKGKSRIYTSTPEKNKIEELDKIKKLKLKSAKRNLADKAENKKQTVEIKHSQKKTKVSNRNVKRPRRERIDASSSDSDTSVTKENRFSDSDSDIDLVNDAESIPFLDDQQILIGDYILVKFCTKKLIKHYVGTVIEILEQEECVVKFMRKTNIGFIFPEQEDISTVLRSDVISKLPRPISVPGTSRMTSFLRFNVNFFGINVD